jgi:ribosome maturation factor RimP
VGLPAGGEMSGLTAHFLFGANPSRKWAPIWPGPKQKAQHAGLPTGRDSTNSVGLAIAGRMAAKLDQIREAAERVAASHGLDVVNVELAGPVKERVLRVFLEKNGEGRKRLKAEIEAGAEGLPERLAEGKLSVEQLSGVTHEDCAAFSQDFGVLLDVEDLVPDGEYTLEASSPGLDRKLSKPEEFQRFAGCLIKVQTFEPVRNNRHWRGRLQDSSSGNITLDLAATNQNSKSRKAGVSTVEIALGNVEKAELIPEI